MKHSLRNDTGLAATKPTDYPGEGNNKGLPESGPTQSPSERLLAGGLVGLANAENDDAPILVSYDSPDKRRKGPNWTY